MTLGYQVIADYFLCDKKKLDNLEYLQQITLDIAKKLKVTVVSENFLHFNPYGISGILVVAESHIAIHTFPEKRIMSLDVYSCDKNVDLKKMVSLFKKAINAKIVKNKYIKRGNQLSFYHRI